MRKQTGFTIVELLIGIALVATITAIAVPNFISWLPNFRLRSASQDMLSNFQKAKLAAVKGNVNVAVCFKSDNSGYTVFVDTNANYADDGEETVADVAWAGYKSLVYNPAYNTFDTTVGARPCMAFQSTGIPVDGSGGAFNTREAQISNTNGRSTKLVVSPAGSVYLENVP
ncbi:MAG: GspH/FimT family pseudopilin [Desulfobacterales bacterium]|nr:GspH/FimT family pseudopilin [Desulfobacterales bacterium]